MFDIFVGSLSAVFLIKAHSALAAAYLASHAIPHYAKVPSMLNHDFSIDSCIPLKLLPAYLGTASIEEALQTARGRRILWLEILVNDQLDPAPWLGNPAFREVYKTACRWYTQYRGLLTYLFNRTPLPLDSGPIDYRDYRTFAEALYFAYHHN